MGFHPGTINVNVVIIIIIVLLSILPVISVAIENIFISDGEAAVCVCGLWLL